MCTFSPRTYSDVEDAHVETPSPIPPVETPSPIPPVETPSPIPPVKTSHMNPRVILHRLRMPLPRAPVETIRQDLPLPPRKTPVVKTKDTPNPITLTIRRHHIPQPTTPVEKTYKIHSPTTTLPEMMNIYKSHKRRASYTSNDLDLFRVKFHDCLGTSIKMKEIRSRLDGYDILDRFTLLQIRDKLKCFKK